MNLFQRITYYGIGLIVGSVFVYFVWGKKGATFDYFPNARVLKDIKNDVREFSPEALEQMKSLELDSASISSILSNGSVDFKNSSPREKPCKMYVVDSESEKNVITLTIKKCDSISTINNVVRVAK
ncbi:MAG: DUF4258 domain-containing protein [Flavobacteriaceae bacterium]|nr:DUF4258 domain-containing protein [Flavobacteriaceae bacterium]